MSFALLTLLTLTTLVTSVAVAQTPLSNLLFSVGTTIRDSGGHDWSYVLLGSPQPALLAGKKFAVFGKSGYPTNAGSFTARGTIFQQTDTTAINSLLNQSLSLNQDMSGLGRSLDTLLHNVPGITNQTLAQKVLVAFQTAAGNPDTSAAITMLSRVNPGLNLCAGQGFSEQITGITTYEVREVSPATGLAGDVVGRVTVVPGPTAPVTLPAPGQPFQVVTNAPSDHLLIRLRWGTPDELRRLSLLYFGFDVWRIPLVAAQAGGYDTTPPQPNDLATNANFVLVNHMPVMAIKDFTTGSGTGAANDPADRTTYFIADDNGRFSGQPGFNDGDQFYYFITARDVLGRDGLVSVGGLAQACRRLTPSAPTGVRVLSTVEVLPLGGGEMTNQQRLVVTWQQNTNASDSVGEYWVYRWPDPSMSLTNDATPTSNQIAVVSQLAGTNVNSFIDDVADAPSIPGPSTYWYTVRAVSHGNCSVLASPNSGPASGVLRQWAAPDATTGSVQGSCGTPVVMFQGINTLANAQDTNNSNYRLTCVRRDLGIAWVQFVVTNVITFPNYVTNIEVFGPIYFAPGNDTATFDYSLLALYNLSPVGVYCTVGTFYGLTSQTAVARITNAPSSTQRFEIAFLAGQLLETALSANDPLLNVLNGGFTSCQSATKPTPDASGTVHMTFNVAAGASMLIQVFTNSAWQSLGVFTPDTNNVYWVPYPACVLGPLPPFQGCLVNLPETGECPQHIARAADGGALAPIRVRFQLTPRTREYRLYRSVDDGPLTLLAQAAAPFDPNNPLKQVVRTDDAMPPSYSKLCYFVQVLDENGNGSPMASLGCKEVPPSVMPRPVLAEPQAIGSITNPQVALNWFCPTGGVQRFVINVARKDQPGSGKPTGFSATKLSAVAYLNTATRYLGLFGLGRLGVLSRFDEAYLTPPVGSNFPGGPQYSTTANVVAGVPYQISVGVTNPGVAGNLSEVWDFTWKPTNALPSVPWPALPPPPVKNFDEDVTGPQRVAAVLLGTVIPIFPFPTIPDPTYPVGIRVADLSAIPYHSDNVGGTNLASYLDAGTIPQDPNEMVFRRLSGDPTRRGDPLFPIVVYRRQVASASFPHVSGSLVQCTPLIEQLPWFISRIGQNTPSIVFADRLLALHYDGLANIDQTTGGWFLYVRDQQPVVAGASYEYFVVRMNNQREIAETIPAGVVGIPGP
ncbi:MAG TPA: hypothetical protein VN281_06595 [Verrucomicrobiae bacterium]|nr:hypothetical protein [Verrucomicrobiae bacterium]